MTSTLSPEQQQALDFIYEGQNTLITGPGGTGKSFLLERIVEDLDALGRKFGIAGATGVAAVNVGGVTLHSWTGIGLGDGHVSSLVSNIRNNVPAFNRIKFSELLLIDEISMISAELLHKIDLIFKQIRESEEPFGGMQMIFVGDFLQLPPVDGHFAFEASCWKDANIKVITLTRVFRQEDKVFAHALSQIRTGRIDDATRATINSRSRIKDPHPEIPPVAITALNKTADTINATRLRTIPGESKIFKAKDKGSPQALKLLQKCLIPAELELKIGARVMCLCNYDPILQIMNGSCGTVVSIPGVYKDGPVDLYQAFRDDDDAEFIGVRFDNGVTAGVVTYEKDIKLNGEVIGSREQYPLRLSWACSSHKAQGSTLDKVELHMVEAFEVGQTYVALSRVRTLEGLFIKSINPGNIKASPKALAFYGIK